MLFVYVNCKKNKIEKEGKTYNSIRLSDIESNNKWIPEK